MKRMSFALTTPQFKARTKDVTRRLGWEDVRPGQVIMGIEKGMGLKKGEKQVELGKIEVVSAWREQLQSVEKWPANETVREGFPEMTAQQFIDMFCRHNGVQPTNVITRIEFKYL